MTLRVGYTWEPTEEEMGLLRKAVKESFEFVTDGHPYWFDEEVRAAVRAALAGFSFVDALGALVASVLNDWNRGVASVVKTQERPLPDWWDEVAIHGYPSTGQWVYRREADDADEEEDDE
jgi:hypothetical protein